MVLMSKLIIYKKSEGRYITEQYVKDNNKIITIFERINSGVVISNISYEKGVLSQKYLKNSTISDSLANELHYEFSIIEKKDAQKTTVEKKCDSCSGTLYRELEAADTWNIKDVPVVPIFRCENCGKRFYSMTKPYLESLVNENKELFEGADILEMEKNKEEFIKTLNEYIIRIFASKKISRI